MKAKKMPAVDGLDGFIQSFMSGAQIGRFEHYFIEGNTLLFKKVITPSHGWNARVELPEGIPTVRTEDGKTLFLAAHVIAKRIIQGDQTHYLGNSSVLPLIGMRSSFGKRQLNRNETDIQRRLSQVMNMLPFGAIRESGLDLNLIQILDKGPAESIVRKTHAGWDKKGQEKFKDERVHFTGACLFRIGENHFLLDIDRGEITHKIFNPFLAQLPCAVTSIALAYESLKPDAVLDAEREGLSVLRQGEWFFIPTPLELKPQMGVLWNGEEGYVRGELRAGDNRPNHSEFYAEVDEVPYVSGLVEHSGREHEPLRLKTWYRAVPNTATRSVTITGDID